MTIGTVKKYFTNRGFGFITGIDGIDYFFHLSNTNLDPHQNYILEGQEAVFYPSSEINGSVVRYRARDVEFIDIESIYSKEV